jgi:hypothetical protein
VANVFVSYRREDSAPWAGRICDRLEAAFGAAHVFMDVDDIAPGEDFTQAIDRKVSGCKVLVAVIGPRWLELLRERAGEHDFVEHEVASALRRGITVIPVLVGAATMPAEHELPPSLASLARRHGISIRDTSFDQDAGELVRGVERASGGGRHAKRLVWLLVAAGVVIALAATAVFFAASRERTSLDGTWIARMQRPGQRAYTIRLTFHTAGQTLTGGVEYPTGSARIEGGTYDGSRLAFFTRHIPQFESEPATIVFSGELRGSEIELTVTTPDGVVTRGTARKAI